MLLCWPRKPQILCEPQHVKEGTGKVLAFRELSMVWDVPLRSAPLVQPGSWVLFGLRGAQPGRCPLLGAGLAPERPQVAQGHLLAWSGAPWE